MEHSLFPYKFYSEVAEAESWIKEKRPMLTTTDMGSDEDSVQVRGLFIVVRQPSLDFCVSY